MKERVFSPEITDCVRGIFAVFIMLGHLGAETNVWCLYPFWKASLMFVGIFFMLSGYGLMRNCIQKTDYWNGFLKRRLLLILIPAYLVYLLQGGVEILFSMKWCGTTTLIRYILLEEFKQRTNWFVFEIMLFYFLFWLFYRFLSDKIANILLGITTIILICFGFYNKIGNFWYASSLCFLFGVLYAQKEKDWNLFICQKYYLKVVLFLFSCMIWITLFLILGNDSVVGNPIAKNMSALFFCLWMLSILQKVRVEFGILRWMGKISYEIFLLHLIWIQVLRVFIISAWLYIFAVITVTLISSCILQIPIEKIEMLIRKKSQ